MTDTPSASSPALTEARRRELAVEHLLFGTIRFVAERHPDLLDALEGSLGHLWDKADDGPRDDKAVRAVAARFIRGLRATTGESGGETAGPTAPGGAS